MTGCIRVNAATEGETLNRESNKMNKIMNSMMKRITVRGLRG
jgi:hypothetical protein